MIHLNTKSLIWWYRISICLDRSWKTRFSKNLIQLWLSQLIIVRSIYWPNKPTKIFLIQIASHAAWLAAMYPASAKISATDLCFLMYQETTTDPILKIPPDVLFLSDRLAAQSALAKPWSFTPFVHLYHNPNWVVPLRYLSTCFAAFQYSLVGITIA